MSRIKEPCFFDEEVAWSRGLDWYRALFRDATPEQICGEASTNYTRWPQVPEVPARIADIMPSVKLIYVVRDPVDRAYSHYVHRHTRELFPAQPFKLNFEEFAKFDPMCIDSSNYAKQIGHYLDYFPKKSILVIKLEELGSNPQETLGVVLQFLGVDDGVDLLRSGRIMENEADGEAKMRLFVTESLRNIPALRKIAYSVPQKWRDTAYKLLRRIGYGSRIAREYSPIPLGESARVDLQNYFEESNQYLEREFGLDLSDWRS